MDYRYARHAKPGKLYGEIDLTVENELLELGEEGIGQAEELGRLEGDNPFGLILSSPFLRALQTAKTVQRVQGNVADLIVLPELKEVNFGAPEKDVLHNWINTGLTEAGESVAEVRARVRRVFDFVNENKVHGLIVAHRLLFSVFLLEIGKYPDETPVGDLKKNKLLDYAECSSLYI